MQRLRFKHSSPGSSGKAPLFCIKIPARFGVVGGRETTCRDAIVGTADEQGWDLMDGRVMVKRTLARCLEREALERRHALQKLWKGESMACEMFTFFSDFSTKYLLCCSPVVLTLEDILRKQDWPAVKAGNSSGHRYVSLLLVKALVVAVGTHDDPQWKN